jgi:DNA processing protein
VSPPSLARLAALSWARGRELTPQRLWPVLRARGGLEALLGSGEEELSEWLGSRERARAVLRAPEDTVVLKWASEVERSGIQLVTAFDPEYPQALREIADPPFLLYALGRIDRLRLPAVSIVGSRDASRYGRDVALRLARELSAAGVAVVSGFARGIDAAAHEAALDSPGGTIAVLGCGIDVDYPREHRRLREKLSVSGLLLSEYPPGTEPRPQNFPIRNRIIAGLSSGVIVVEASRRSGSLITARLASDFGRDVFAVPGSIFSETSAGTHELLRDGAILCRGTEDVLSELFPSVGPPQRVAAARAVDLSPEARRLLDALAREESLSADDLAEALELPAATVLAGLFELEGAGLAVPVEGGRYGISR